MADSTSQGNDALNNDMQGRPQDSDPLGNDSQVDPQDGAQSQNNNPLTVFDPATGQDSTSRFERCFATIYPSLTSLMSKLNRLDFKNLQLAGFRALISREIQKKYLIPSKCDEKLLLPGFSPGACSNTTQTVHEIKACHGMHHDGWGLRGRQEKWMEPTKLFKHVPKSNALVQTSKENDGGHFDSYNVCIQCHNRDRRRRRPYEDLVINTFYTEMCQFHSLKYIEQQPYNACRCRTFLEKYWRCHVCSLDTLDELKLRAQSFGDVAYPTFTFNDEEQLYIDGTTGGGRRDTCPILGCTCLPWTTASFDKQVWMCRACTAIFPPLPPLSENWPRWAKRLWIIFIEDVFRHLVYS